MDGSYGGFPHWDALSAGDGAFTRARVHVGFSYGYIGKRNEKEWG